MIRTGTPAYAGTQPWREILPHLGIMEQGSLMTVVSLIKMNVKTVVGMAFYRRKFHIKYYHLVI